MAKFKYLTYDDRLNIEKMYKSGMSTPKIANALGKNYSTVYRELHRYPDDYTADKAQADADSKKKGKYDITITPKGSKTENLFQKWQHTSRNVPVLLQEKWRDA